MADSIQSKKEGPGLMKGVFVAYFVLFFHVVLIAGVGVLVIFFRGILEYMLWIVGGILALVLVSGIWLYLRMRAERAALSDTMQSPEFQGKSMEISVLGGLAAFRIGRQPPANPVDYPPERKAMLLEDSNTQRVRQLNELARLLEKDLITLDEFNQAKQELFNE